MNRRMPEKSQREKDLAALEGQLDAIELAAAVVDGGIDPAELTDEQLRILLADETAEVVAALLSKDEEEEESEEADEGKQAGVLVFTSYLRRWSPVIGSAAVAAAIVVVGLVGFRPSAQLDWSGPINVGTLPVIKSPSATAGQPLLAFLEVGDRQLFVIDSMTQSRGRALSVALGWIDAKGRLVPHAVVTFQRVDTTDFSAIGIAGVTARGGVVDEAWIEQLCKAGYGHFAASIADGEACWGIIGPDCETGIVSVSNHGGNGWLDGFSDREGAAPDTSLRTEHKSALYGVPFPIINAWH